MIVISNYPIDKDKRFPAPVTQHCLNIHSRLSVVRNMRQFK